jgi:EAL domain-containing protein (putative c-di-GMP-specific phosphodiesterase class I)/GGDEF domain-containing protein
MSAIPAPAAPAPRPEPSLLTAFQPIVGLRDGLVTGFEALTRATASYGPADIRELFALAQRDGAAARLERRCWQTALASSRAAFGRRAGWSNLFLNVLPESLHDDGLLADTLALLDADGLQPAQLVVEITESSRIEDYPRLRRIVQAWRQLGFRIAIDDAGAGHSGLQTIVELEPDFVKADRSLVTGVHEHAGRRAAIESLLLLTRRMGIALIAEGIETEQELMELRRLGVAYGQGYLLARPAPVPEELSPEVRRLLVAGQAPRQSRVVLPGPRIGDVLAPTPTVDAETRTEAVAALFDGTHLDGIVVTDAGRPAGLLMRSAFHRCLAERFGHELYWHRGVLAMAARDPLILDARTTLDEAARAVAERPEAQRYDAIIVVRDERYLGTVAVHRLLEALAEQRLTAARHENPLSGLPGNPAIEAELRARLDAGRAFAALYVDLDWFKAFNDVYGVHHGDRAIRAVAHALRALRDAEGRDTFLGHVGGDDFVLVSEPERAAALEAGIQDWIPAELARLYAASDRQRGWLETAGRDGAPARVPLATVTVAVTRVEAASALDVDDVLGRLSAAKRARKAAKPTVA